MRNSTKHIKTYLRKRRKTLRNSIIKISYVNFKLALKKHGLFIKEIVGKTKVKENSFPRNLKVGNTKITENHNSKKS